MEADTAKNLGALEAQLLALSNTKNDMRTLRTHIAGLEEALEELNTANDGLRRELGRKSELIERHSKRIQQQQERLFDLENAASEAAREGNTPIHLSRDPALPLAAPDGAGLLADLRSSDSVITRDAPPHQSGRRNAAASWRRPQA